MSTVFSQGYLGAIVMLSDDITEEREGVNEVHPTTRTPEQLEGLLRKITSDRARIVVIADEEMLRTLFVRMLQKEFGYHTSEYGSLTPDAFTAAYSAHLVLSDVDLKGDSGLRFVEELRRDYDQQQLPIVLMSGYPVETRSADERKKADLANTYLTKPLEISTLKQVVSELLPHYVQPQNL